MPFLSLALCSNTKIAQSYLTQSLLGYSHILAVVILLLQKFLYSFRVVRHAQTWKPFLLKGQLGLNAVSSFLKHTLLLFLTWSGQE